MMKKKKSLISLLLNLILVCSLLINLAPAAKAYISSADEAINLVRSKLWQGIDTDGYPSGQPYQCVDLIVWYYEQLGAPRPYGDGKDYATNALPSGWQRIQGAVPQKGDILVYGASSRNPYGHVAIFESERSHYHQNFDNHPYVEQITYRYNGLSNPYWGVIRPSFSGSPSTPSSLITWTNSLSTPWETDAKLEIRANAPYSGSWGEVGITVWDANGNVVAQKVEASAPDARTYLDIWYNLTAETGAVLNRNSYYTYQFHVYFNGTRYESGIGNFTTKPCSIHTPEIIPAVPATCIATGKTEGSKCSVCNLVLTEQQDVPVGGHSEVTVAGKAATCTEPGKTDGKKCSVCGTVTVKQTTIKAKGHTEVTIPGKEATCTETGLTAGKKCSVCKTVTVKQDTIKAKGHTYTNDKDIDCNVCGAVREEEVASVPMYRMYDPNSGEHFYTGSTVERDFLVSAGWHYEGVGFNFPREGKPVYRLYEPVFGEHLYTMDKAEKAKLISWGWNDEGVAFNSAGEDEVPQYRLHNPNAKRGGYHFTGSEEERDFLISIGWINEGIGWYSCVE